MALKSRFAKVSSFHFVFEVASQEIASLRFTIVYFFVCVRFFIFICSLIALKSVIRSVYSVFKKPVSLFVIHPL